MTTDQNKVTVRRFYEEVWNKENVDFAFEIFAGDYIRHDLRLTKALPGPEGQRRLRQTSGRRFRTWNGPSI